MRLRQLFESSIIQTNATLNPAIWSDHSLKSDVRQALIKIAKAFYKSIKIPLDIKDVVITGSSANYNWTRYSDLDLHLVIPGVPSDSDRELFSSKKDLWSLEHNVTVKHIPVELYVQGSDEPHHSTGVYSILNNKWLIKPSHTTPQVDDNAVKAKLQDVSQRIYIALLSNEVSQLKKIKKQISKMRKAGLESGGEFSTENLVFKALRNLGLIDQLRTTIRELEDEQLSLEQVQTDEAVSGALANIGGEKEHPEYKGKGSSRIWMDQPEYSASVDDDDETVHKFSTGHKMAKGGSAAGIKQATDEYRLIKKLNQFVIYQKTADNKFKYNPNGILLPIIEKGTSNGDDIPHSVSKFGMTRTLKVDILLDQPEKLQAIFNKSPHTFAEMTGGATVLDKTTKKLRPFSSPVEFLTMVERIGDKRFEPLFKSNPIYIKINNFLSQAQQLLPDEELNPEELLKPDNCGFIRLHNGKYAFVIHDLGLSVKT